MLHLLIPAIFAAEPVNVELPLVYAQDLVWSGQTIAVAGDGGVALFSPDGTPGAFFESRSPVDSVRLSGDGARLAFTNIRGGVSLADASGEILEQWRVARWGSADVAISPSGEQVIVFAPDHATLYSAAGARELYGMVSNSGEGAFLTEDLVLARAPSGDLLRVPLNDPSRAEHIVSLTGAGGTVQVAGDRIYMLGWQSNALERIADGQSRFIHLPGVTGVRAFAPHPTDGRVAYGIRSVDRGVTVVVYDPVQERFWLPPVGRVNAVADLAWSPDGQRLAVATDQRLLVVDVPAEPISGPPPLVAVDAVDFSADGRSALVLYATGELWSRDLESGVAAPVERLDLSVQSWEGPLTAALPDGLVAHGANNDVVTFGEDGAIRSVLMPRVSDLYQLRTAPDGAVAMVGSGWIRVVDAEGEVVADQPFPMMGMVAVAPGGERVAYLDFNGDLIVYDLRNGRVLARIAARPIGLGFLSDGTLVMVSDHGRVSLWRGADAEAPEASGLVAGELPDTLRVAFQGSRMLATGAGGDLLLQELPAGRWVGDIVHGWPWEYNQAYERLAIHPDKPLVLTANTAGVVQLWDMEARNLVATLGAPLPMALAAAVDPAGAVWVSHADRGIGPLEAGTSGALQPFEVDVLDLAFSPDGALLALAHADGSVRVLRRSDGSTLWEVDPFEYVARQVLFSADGQTLFAVDDLGNVVGVSLANGEAFPVAGAAGYLSLAGDTVRSWNGYDLGRYTDGAWEVVQPRGRRLQLAEFGASCGDRFVVGASYGYGIAFYRFDGASRRPKRLPTDEDFQARAVACAGDRVAIVDTGGVLRIYALEDGAPLARVELGAPSTDLLAVDPNTYVMTLLDGRALRYTLSDDTLTTFVVRDDLAPGVINFPQEQP